MASSQLILVSNRLPVTVHKDGGKLTFEVSAGGLPSAMSALPKSAQMTWIGWPGIASDNLTAADKRQITQELAKYNCQAVHLTEQQVSDYYEGYSNSTLWPLFHYFPQNSLHVDRYWNEYKKVNALFAKAIAKLAEPDATIWVHDYHLMLLPRLLRKALPTSTIGFFLHIPFPSYEIFRQLPGRRDILSGVLGADLLGFHIYDYATHFAHSAQRILGLDHSMSAIYLKDRITRIDAFPIGIDYDKFAQATAQPEVKAEIARLKKHFKDKRLILSMDRLDYSKGILNRLEAFDAFLERNPQYHGQVVMAAIAIPSRTQIEAYQQMRDQIDQAVSRINGRFGTVDWTPISYQYKNLPFEQIAALYAQSSVALVTPLRDGMNLVAKEYLATKKSTPGVLIISEMAGAVDELPEATKVNPNDRAAMVRAIERALAMPLIQQRRRLRIMQSRIAKYNARRWAEDFLEQLHKAHASRIKHAAHGLGKREREQLVRDYCAAKRRLVLVDYDGTLVDFASTPDPALVRLPPRRRAVISKLAAQPNTTLAIISGRQRNILQSWFSEPHIVLSSEHGAWIRQDGEWRARTSHSVDWKMAVYPVLLSVTERTPGSMIEEKEHALVWHFRNVTPDLAYVRASKLRHDLRAVLKDPDIEIYDGQKIIEIKHRSINKGAAAEAILKNGNYDFVMAIGDDYTDEHMFAAIADYDTSYSLRVGPGETKAKMSLPSVDAVHKLLAELAKI